MPRKVAVVVASQDQSLFFGELAVALQCVLREWGWSCEVISRSHHQVAGLVFLLGTSSLKAFIPQKGQKVIYWNMEQLPVMDGDSEFRVGRLGELVAHLAKVDVLMDMSSCGLRYNRVALESVRPGLAMVWCPLGYHSVFDSSVGRNSFLQDFLFFGLLTDRRRVSLGRMGTFGRVVASENLWGTSRRFMIQASKAVVNVRFCEGVYTEYVRIVGLVMSSGVLLVSEKLAPDCPFIPGEHFVEFEVGKEESLSWVCRDDARRGKIVASAKNFLLSNFRMSTLLRQALNSVGLL